MRAFFHSVRAPGPAQPFARQARNSVLLLLAGLASGMTVKLLDLSTQNLGNLFSQMSVWILLGTIFSVCSRSPWRASLNVFLFCAGMLLTYYMTAELTQSPYSLVFVWGWSAFSLCSPVFAFFTWYAAGRGWFAKLISCGILLCILLCAALLFDRIRFSDLVLTAATGLFLFFPRKKQAF